MSVRRETVRNRQTGRTYEYWRVDFVMKYADGRTERIRAYPPVQTKRGAEQYERERRLALEQQYEEARRTAEAPRKEMPTFGEFAEERWLGTYPASVGNRPTTIQEKKDHVRLYLLPTLKDVPLNEVRGEGLAKLFASLREPDPATGRRRGLSEKTIKNVRATLRKILQTAIDWEVMDGMPKLPLVRAPDPSWDFYIPEECELLLAKGAPRAEERALFVFALRAGPRAGEQLALEWGDIDWHNRTVIFRRASARGTGEVGPTKGKRERYVPLAEQVIQALKEIRHLRGPLVFCNPDGTRMNVWQLNEKLRAAARRAGLRAITWHDLRHSFASNLVAAGVPLRQVQEWLGHSTITTTMRYAHLAPGGAAHLIEAFGGRTDSGSVRASRGER
jgi:integrase